MHLVCYLRESDRVFETYWTTLRGVEAMDYSYALMDLTVYGRRSCGRPRPPAGHNSGKRDRRTCGLTDAPSPSGRDSKPDALTISPLGADRQWRGRCVTQSN